MNCLSDYYSPLVKGGRGLPRKVERCVLVSPISLVFAVHEYANLLYFAFLMSISCQSLAFYFFVALKLRVLVFILVQFCRS